VFVSQLEDTVVEMGETATFKCNVTGIPRPTLVWYIEDEPVVDGPQFETSFVDNVATLEIKDIKDDQPMFITCKAENVAGEARSSAELIVEGIFV